MAVKNNSRHGAKGGNWTNADTTVETHRIGQSGGIKVLWTIWRN